jgi:hypothetical protein
MAPPLFSISPVPPFPWVSQPEWFQADGESLALKKLPTFRNDQAAGLVYVPNTFEYAGTVRVGIMRIEAGVISSRL